MEMTLRERLFRAQRQVRWEETQASRAAFLGCVACFWIVALGVLLVVLSTEDRGLSRVTYIVAAAALPLSFLLGRRHARRMCQQLWP